jgi:nitric oxide reductase activation protein
MKESLDLVTQIINSEIHSIIESTVDKYLLDYKSSYEKPKLMEHFDTIIKLYEKDDQGSDFCFYYTSDTLLDEACEKIPKDVFMKVQKLIEAKNSVKIVFQSFDQIQDIISTIKFFKHFIKG